jgi:hypothetical protein
MSTAVIISWFHRSLAPAILLVTAVPATAQSIDDLFMQQGKLSRSETELARALPQYTDCLVAHPGKELGEFLGLDWWPARAAAWRLIKAHPECPVPKGYRSGRQGELRGALLEAFLRRDYADTPAPPNFDKVPFLVHVEKGIDPYFQPFAVAIMEFYDCITRRQPQKVQAFLRTQPTSDGEAAAFAALSKDIGACIRKGQQWTLQASRSRPFLAESFYSLMRLTLPPKRAA